MRELKKPGVIDTLGKLLDKGDSFNLWCIDCRRIGLTGTEPFIAKLGARIQPMLEEMRYAAKSDRCCSATA